METGSRERGTLRQDPPDPQTGGGTKEGPSPANGSWLPLDQSRWGMGGGSINGRTRVSSGLGDACTSCLLLPGDTQPPGLGGVPVTGLEGIRQPHCSGAQGGHRRGQRAGLDVATWGLEGCVCAAPGGVGDYREKDPGSPAGLTLHLGDTWRDQLSGCPGDGRDLRFRPEGAMRAAGSARRPGSSPPGLAGDQGQSLGLFRLWGQSLGVGLLCQSRVVCRPSARDQRIGLSPRSKERRTGCLGTALRQAPVQWSQWRWSQQIPIWGGRQTADSRAWGRA